MAEALLPPQVEFLGMPTQPPPSAERLLALVDAFEDQRVLMLVDLVADRFVTGTPKRISREAPVLILRHAGEVLVPGGGANAAANVRALGGVPLVLGVVGDDESGRGLVDCLEERGIATGGVRVRHGYRTPTKTRIVAGGRHSIKQQIVRLDVEDDLELWPEDRAAFSVCLERWATEPGGRPHAGILSDYGYGAVEPSLVGAVRDALAPGGIVLCDSRRRLGDFAGLDGATPNEEEAEAMLGGPLDDDGPRIDAGGRALLEKLSARFLLVTRGSRGMALFERGAASAHLPVHGTDQVADVTGAGDTVIGAFALALAAGATPLEAALVANYAGGIVVMKLGTATATRDELRGAIRTDPRPLASLRWGAS
jgi:rfaE bifunctional protein kinase chain/domain